ncbi:OmpA family protein [Desulfuromonas versatilis]|nr:hypothetical protein [Desulfuromonas versatilis]
MNLPRLLFVPLLLLLFSCAPPRGPAPLDEAALRAQLAALPGGEAGQAGPPGIRFPGESLFPHLSALPRADEAEGLGALAALLRAHQGTSWQAVVRAATGVSAEYDLVLAQKRAELLERYFRKQGVDAQRLAISAEAGEGAPLEIVLRRD